MTKMLLAISILLTAAAPAFADCDVRGSEALQRKVEAGIQAIDYQRIETNGQLATDKFAGCATSVRGHERLDFRLAESRMLVITAKAHLHDRAGGDKSKAASMLRDAVRLANQAAASPKASQSDMNQAADVLADVSRLQSRP